VVPRGAAKILTLEREKGPAGNHKPADPIRREILNQIDHYVTRSKNDAVKGKTEIPHNTTASQQIPFVTMS